MTIAIWGNNGAGKSTVAIKLALALADKKKNVVLVDADYNAPQINVWYPRMDVKLESSLARILDSTVDVEHVASKIQVVNKYFGVLGYTKDFASASMPKRSDTIHTFLKCLGDVSDYIIVDCQSCPINDIITFEAANSADVVLAVMTPDIKALSWYDSNVRMLEENWANGEKTELIRVLNKVTDVSPAEELEEAMGPVKYLLPHSIDIADEIYTGELGTDNYRKKARYYAAVIDTIADDISERNS